MILAIDTSTPVCKLDFIENEWRYSDSWEAGRELAKGLLGYLQDQLHAQGKSWEDVSGLVVFRGPGSFTGLRIGSTVFNTLAYARSVPVVGETGEDWLEKGLERLANNENDTIVLPEYGGEANITLPRK